MGWRRDGGDRRRLPTPTAAACRCSACQACLVTFGAVCPRPAGDVGPSLGMKKSSSLESLQTMVHEVRRQWERRDMIACVSCVGDEGGSDGRRLMNSNLDESDRSERRK